LRDTQQGYWQINSDGVITDANEAACSMSGYRQEELVGEHISIISTERSHPEDMDAYNKELKKREVVQLKTQHRRKDGSVYDVSVFLRYHPEIDNGIFVGFTRDITERNKVIAKLKEYEARYQSLLMTADRVIVLDADMRILSVNEAYCVMCSKTLDQLVGHSFSEQLHPTVVKKTKRCFDAVMKTHNVQRDEGWTRITRRYLLRTFSPIFNGDVSCVGVTITGKDITEHKRAVKRIDDCVCKTTRGSCEDTAF
jgi:PAS domain S-box-containing protein